MHQKPFFQLQNHISQPASWERNLHLCVCGGGGQFLFWNVLILLVSFLYWLQKGAIELEESKFLWFLLSYHKIYILVLVILTFCHVLIILWHHRIYILFVILIRRYINHNYVKIPLIPETVFSHSFSGKFLAASWLTSVRRCYLYKKYDVNMLFVRNMVVEIPYSSMNWLLLKQLSTKKLQICAVFIKSVKFGRECKQCISNIFLICHIGLCISKMAAVDFERSTLVKNWNMFRILCKLCQIVCLA